MPCFGQMSGYKTWQTWAREHFLTLLLVNTVCLQMTAFCFCEHFTQRPNIFWVVFQIPLMEFWQNTSK